MRWTGAPTSVSLNQPCRAVLQGGAEGRQHESGLAAQHRDTACSPPEDAAMNVY